MQVLINGVRTKPEDATISIFDRGFLFGDAVYDVISTHGRTLFQLDAHLDRLERSGEAIGLDVKSLRPKLEQGIAELLESAPPEGELYVRIMVTQGESRGIELLDPESTPTWIVICKALHPMPGDLFTQGISLLAVRPDEIVGRIAPSVKSNNRQANVMAHRHARDRGYDDALFVDPKGNVTEGPTWNVFAVSDGKLATPALEGGILPGITRGLILELCAKLGVPAEERTLSLDAIKAADELFITSTTRGVMPVGKLDGSAVGAVPGPITAKLSAALKALERGESQ